MPAARVLFVCMGNICRSPTAEGVMRGLVEEAGLSDQIVLDSAGTGGWHVGAAPDRRSVAAAAGRGIRIDGAARQVRRADFDEFDLLVALDDANARDLRRLAPDERAAAKVRLLREFDPRRGRRPRRPRPVLRRARRLRSRARPRRCRLSRTARRAALRVSALRDALSRGARAETSTSYGRLRAAT